MALGVALADHAGKQPSAPNIALALSLTLDAAYPAGGYAFDAQALLQSEGNYDKAPPVLAVLGQRSAGFDVEYVDDVDPANRKIKVLNPDGTEASGDLSVTPGTIKVLILAQ